MLGTITLLAQLLQQHLDAGDFEGLNPITIPTTDGVHSAPDAVRLVLTTVKLVTVRAEREESLNYADVTNLLDDLLTLEALLTRRDTCSYLGAAMTSRSSRL
jgi:hypothetical protein